MNLVFMVFMLVLRRTTDWQSKLEQYGLEIVWALTECF